MSSQSKNLVTVFGGTGFVGRHIVKQLSAHGVAVRVAARHPHMIAIPAALGGPIEYVEADILNEASVAEAVSGASTVVNAVSLYFERGEFTFDTIHVQGARRIAQLSLAAGVKRLIHVSGIGVRADSPSRFVQARAAGEMAVREAFPCAVMVRPSVIFGPKDAFLSGLEKATRAPILAPLFGNGNQYLQPVYVEDVAEAIQKLVQTELAVAPIYELGGPDIFSYRTLLELVLQHLNRSRLMMPIPFPVWKLVTRAMTILPNPPLTPDQVTLMAEDNTVGKHHPGFSALGIRTHALKSKLAACLAVK